MANQFKNAKAVDVGLAYVTVYTAPAGVTATVIGASFSNKLGTAITVNSRIRDNDDGGAFAALLGTDTPIDPGGALAFCLFSSTARVLSSLRIAFTWSRREPMAIFGSPACS